jgi:hypothetical protein
MASPGESASSHLRHAPGCGRAGGRDGAAVLASAAIPARWAGRPLLDQHIAVRLPFAGQAPAGLPGPGSLDRLRGLEDELTGRLPPYVLLVVHETTRGAWTLHLYVGSGDHAVTGQVRDVVFRWPGAAVSARPDAGWRAICHLGR